MSLGQAIGLVIAFTLACIPSGLFVGLLLGKALGLAAWLRWLGTVLMAGWLAYGMVFSTPLLDPLQEQDYQDYLEQLRRHPNQ